MISRLTQRNGRGLGLGFLPVSVMRSSVGCILPEAPSPVNTPRPSPFGAIPIDDPVSRDALLLASLYPLR